MTACRSHKPRKNRKACAFGSLAKPMSVELTGMHSLVMPSLAHARFRDLPSRRRGLGLGQTVS